MQTELFYNTIGLSGAELQQAKDNCNKQEQSVLDLMVPGRQYTPIQVHSMYCSIHGAVPLTSIRRAMTCLTDKNRLVMLNVMRMEAYGKNNHLWMKNRND